MHPLILLSLVRIRSVCRMREYKIYRNIWEIRSIMEVSSSCWCNLSRRQYSNCKAFSITPLNRILCPDNKDRRRRILSFSIHLDESVFVLSTATIISRNTYTLLTALTPPNDTFQQRGHYLLQNVRLERKIEYDRYGRTFLRRSLKSVIKHRIYLFFLTLNIIISRTDGDSPSLIWPHSNYNSPP